MSPDADKPGATHTLPALGTGAGRGWCVWRKPAVWLPLLALTATVWLFSLHAFEGVDEHHDGMALVPAVAVADGAVLYRDVFSMYAPLSCAIQAGAVKALGPRLTSIRWVTVVFYGVGAALLMLCSLKVLPLAPSLAVLGLWLLLGPPFQPAVFHSWPSVYAMAFQFATWYVLLRGAGTPAGSRKAVLCGILIALTFWCKQTVGLLLAVTVCTVLATDAIAGRASAWRRAGAALSWVVLGVAAVSLPIMVTFWWHAAAGDMLDQAWRFPKEVARHYGYWSLVCLRRCLLLRDPLRPLAELGLALGVAGLASRCARAGRSKRSRIADTAGIALLCACWALLAFAAKAPGGETGAHHPLMHPAWNLFPLGALATLAVAAFGTVRRRPPRPGGETARLGVTALIALSSWLQYYPVPCVRHGFWACGPMLVCLVWVLWRAWRANNGRGRSLRSLAALITLLVFCRTFVSGAMNVSRNRPAHQRLSHPAVLAGISLRQDDAHELSGLMDVVEQHARQHPDAAVILWGQDSLPLLYFPQSTYATPFFLIWGPLASLDPALGRPLLELMAERQPVLLRQHKLYWTPVDTTPKIPPEYLEALYTKTWQDKRGESEVWLPRPDGRKRLAAMLRRRTEQADE